MSEQFAKTVQRTWRILTIRLDRSLSTPCNDEFELISKLRMRRLELTVDRMKSTCNPAVLTFLPL